MGATHDVHLLVYVVKQNLVGISAVIFLYSIAAEEYT